MHFATQQQEAKKINMYINTTKTITQKINTSIIIK